MAIFKRKNGIFIYYEITGPLETTNETILLIGGLTRDHTIWRKVLPLLKKKYRIILPDNRDAGRSTNLNNEYDISALAEDISDLLMNLKLGPVHIIGHSMGGFMGFHIAAKHSELVKTLVLCSTAEKQTNAGIEYLSERIKLINSNPSDEATPANREDIMAVMNKIYAPDTLMNQSFVEEIVNFETANPYPQTKNAFKRQAIACINHNAEALLKNINCPTLIMTGKHDKTFPPKVAYNLAKKLFHSKVSIIPSAAHMIQLEQPELLCNALNHFISENSHEETSTPRRRSKL